LRKKNFHEKILPAFNFLVSVTNYAQIKGTVSDDKGNPLPFVTVFQEDTYNGTTSMR
jgi:hypothetical protein